ncbi:MAG: hypothetical protein R6U27_10255 [Desulfobacterales bacterium]
MSSFLEIIKYIPVLIAALVLGNWFMAEVKKAKIQKKPWYAPYLSIPGILILLALSLPIAIKIIYG